MSDQVGRITQLSNAAVPTSTHLSATGSTAFAMTNATEIKRIAELQAELALARSAAEVNLKTSQQLRSELIKKDEEIARLNANIKWHDENESRLQARITSLESCERSIVEAVSKTVEYLDKDNLNIICSTSLLHKQLRRALDVYNTRHEVMNPPASAAMGAEARNLNSANVMGLGEVHRASEARPADDVPAPTEWDDYEEDGPQDLENTLDKALDKAFPAPTEGEQS